MKVPRGWGDTVEKTWLAKADSRKRVQRKVDEWLQSYRKPVDDVPMTIESAHEDILGLGKAGLWFSCSGAISLTAELLIGAQEGGLFKVADTHWQKEKNPRAWVHIQGLRHLRNAVCHPAQLRTGSKELTHIEQLRDHVKNFDSEEAEISQRIQEWKKIRDRQVAEYALRKLRLFGDCFITRHCS